MSFMPMLWTVWVVLVAITAALQVYKMSLERDEEDQIFLDDSFSQEKKAQEEIVAKVNRVVPISRSFIFASAGVTVVIIGYYLWDIFHTLFA